MAKKLDDAIGGNEGDDEDEDAAPEDAGAPGSGPSGCPGDLPERRRFTAGGLAPGSLRDRGVDGATSLAGRRRTGG